MTKDNVPEKPEKIKCIHRINCIDDCGFDYKDNCFEQVESINSMYEEWERYHNHILQEKEKEIDIAYNIMQKTVREKIEQKQEILDELTVEKIIETYIKNCNNTNVNCTLTRCHDCVAKAIRKLIEEAVG